MPVLWKISSIGKILNKMVNYDIFLLLLLNYDILPSLDLVNICLDQLMKDSMMG